MATINGTSGNDSLTGTTGNDTINGLGGNDTLNGNGGTDFFDGGAGFDSLDFRSISGALTIDFSAGTVSGGASGSFTGIERVQAGTGHDSLIGSAGGQNLAGQGGNDTLWGAAGVDTLWGGSGNDQFVFRETGSADADTLGDFASGADKVVLDASVMTALGREGNFAGADDRFWASATGAAHDANDRIVYNTTTRQIFYDADGNGSGAAVRIATLQSGGTLAATDIVVVNGAPPAGSVINGTEGNDTLVGTPGNDTINGLGGDDLLDWSGGDDFFDGGAGNDEINGAGDNDTVFGGTGNDMVTGTHVFGGDGNDVLNFENMHGPDTLDGGAGDDIFYAGLDDVLVDSGGIDTVITNESWTLAAGFENLSFVNFTFRDDGMPGLEGIGNELANRMHTYAGDSGLLDGRAGNDTLIGGFRGADTLIGGSGNDVLTGDDGGDSFMFTVAPGGANADEITDFTSGSDTIVLDGAVHANSGPSGDLADADARFAANATGNALDASDRVIYNTSNGQLWYDADGNGGGARQLIATLQGAPALAATDISITNGTAPSGAVVNGTAGNDTLTGTTGNDTINGLGGNDVITASAGADVIDGGAGFDSIDYKSVATSGIVVDFNAGSITGGFAGGSVSFTGIERVVGSNFSDSMSGAAGGQNLTGSGGNDTLWGATGVDTLWGGNGNDFFVFREQGTANADRVSDFASGQDKLQFDDAAFIANGPTGNFAAGDARFWASSTGTAHDSSDRVLYNTSNGQLLYDADGNGAGAAQLVATLTTIPAIAATDIAII